MLVSGKGILNGFSGRR